MSKDFYDFSEVQLEKIFSNFGLSSVEVQRAIADYRRYRESEMSNFSLLTLSDIKYLGGGGLAKQIMKLKDGREIISNILRAYTFYLKEKKAIAEKYEETKDWEKVISTSVYSDVDSSQEAFIDFVEETYKTKIKDATQLQELINTKDTDFKVLEEILIASRYSKYFRALETALDNGANYKDLLEIKPKDFNLPETWSGCLASDQYSSILWVIEGAFLIGEPTNSVRPSLKDIAREIEAPYSVLMDASKICNQWRI